MFYSLLAGIKIAHPEEELQRSPDEEDKMLISMEDGVCRLWGYFRRVVRYLDMILRSDRPVRQ